MSVRKLTAQFEKDEQPGAPKPKARPRGKTAAPKFNSPKPPAPPPKRSPLAPPSSKPRSYTTQTPPTLPARPGVAGSSGGGSGVKPARKGTVTFGAVQGGHSRADSAPFTKSSLRPVAPVPPRPVQDTDSGRGRVRSQTTGVKWAPPPAGSSTSTSTSGAVVAGSSGSRGGGGGGGGQERTGLVNAEDVHVHVGATPKKRKSTWAGKTWNRLRSTTTQSRPDGSGGSGGGSGGGGAGVNKKRRMMIIAAVMFTLLIAASVAGYFLIFKKDSPRSADEVINEVASKVIDSEQNTATLDTQALGMEFEDVLVGGLGDSSIKFTGLQMMAQKDFTWDEYYTFATGKPVQTPRQQMRVLQEQNRLSGLLGDLDLDSFADFARDGRGVRRMPGVVFKGTCSLFQLVDITATVGLFVDQPADLRKTLDFTLQNVSLVLWVDVDRTFDPVRSFPILKQVNQLYNTTTLLDRVIPRDDFAQVVVSSTPFTLRLANNTDVRHIKRGINWMTKVQLSSTQGFEDLESLLDEGQRRLTSFIPSFVASFPFLHIITDALAGATGIGGGSSSSNVITLHTTQILDSDMITSIRDQLRNTTLAFTFNDLSLETDSVYIDSTEGITISLTGFDQVKDLSLSTGFKFIFGNDTGAPPLYVRGWGRTTAGNPVLGNRFVFIGGILDILPGQPWRAPFGPKSGQSVEVSKGYFEAHMVLPCGIRSMQVKERRLRELQQVDGNGLPTLQQKCGLELESLVFEGAGALTLNANKYAVQVSANATDGQVVFYVQGAALSSTGKALALFDTSNRFPLESQMSEGVSFDVSVSTADDLFTRPDGRLFQRGVLLRAAGSRLRTGTVSEALQVLDGDVTKLPFQVYAYVPVYDIDVRRWTVSVSTNGLILGEDVTLTTASFALDGLTTRNVNIDALATMRVDLPESPLDLSVRAKWAGSVERIEFAGGLNEPWISPFGNTFVDIMAADVAFVYQKGTPLFLDFNADLLFRTASHRIPVRMNGVIRGKNVRFSAHAVLVEEINADLADNIIGNGNVSAVFTNHDYFDTVKQLEFKKGITLYAELFQPTHKALDGSLSALSEADGDLPVKVDWRLSVFLPIFGGRENWKVELYAREIPLLPSMVLSNTSVSVQVSPEASFLATLQSALVFKLERNPPLVLTVSAKLDSEKQRFDFRAELPGWKDPFGMKWWNLGKTTFDIVLDYGVKPVEKSVVLRTVAQFTFTKEPLSFAIEGGLINGDAYFVARSLELKSLKDMFCEFLGEIGCNIANNEFIAGLPIFNRPFDIAVTTAREMRLPKSSVAAQRLRLQSLQHNKHLHPTHPLHTLATAGQAGPRLARGLNIFTALKLNGPILAKLIETFGNRFGNASFSFGTAFPVFDPLNINEFNLRFATTGFRVSDAVYFNGIELDVTPFKVPPEFSVAVELAVQFPKNPELVYFAVSGALSPVEFVIGGSMVGLWRDAFGLKGFVVGNAAIELGVAAGPIISRVALSVEMHFGEIKVKFAGRAAANLLQVYIEARIENLSLRNLVLFWNNLVPTKYEINEEKVPNIVEFKLLHFMFAPTSGSIQGVTYQQGFRLAADVIFFDSIRAQAAIGSMERKVTILGKSLTVTDFGLDVEIPFGEIINAFVDWFEGLFDKIDLGAVGELLKKAGLAVIKGVKDIARIDRFAIKDFRLFDMATGKFPKIELDIVILGKKLELRVDLDFRSLAKSIVQVFKDLFNLDKLLPECIIDRNCRKVPGKPRCDHTRGWRCVKECRGLFKKGVLGTGCW